MSEEFDVPATSKKGTIVVKYNIPRRDYFSIDMPVGAKLLRVMDDNNEPSLFVLAETSRELERRYFHVVTALEDIEGPSVYVDSFAALGETGGIIIHLFETKRILQ